MQQRSRSPNLNGARALGQHFKLLGHREASSHNSLAVCTAEESVWKWETRASGEVKKYEQVMDKRLKRRTSACKLDKKRQQINLGTKDNGKTQKHQLLRDYERHYWKYLHFNVIMRFVGAYGVWLKENIVPRINLICLPKIFFFFLFFLQRQFSCCLDDFFFFLVVPLSEENPTFSFRAGAKLDGAGVDDGSNFYQKKKKKNTDLTLNLHA